MKGLFMSRTHKPQTSLARECSLIKSASALAVICISLNGVIAMSAQAQGVCAKPATVRIQEWPGDIINIVPWVAEAKGMFGKHCLDVNFVPLVGGPPAMVALVNNTIDFANQAPDNIIRSRSKGVEVRMTSNMYAGHWSALVAGNAVALPHASEGYPAIVNDLAGKNIGVTALGGTTEAFMQSAFEGAGMSPSSATFIAVGGVNTAVPALKGRVVDAAMMFGTGPELAEALGAGKIVLDYRVKRVGPKPVQALWGSTLTWAAYGPYIDKNPDVVAAFTTANDEAIAWALDPRNRDELYRIVDGRMPLPDAVPDRKHTLKRIIDVNAGLLAVGIPREAIEGWTGFLMSLKQITSPIGYEVLVWKTGRP
jgi:ABC-type nitrate/sulfonate/bicarbonate transport system substrate-binding protein